MRPVYNRALIYCYVLTLQVFNFSAALLQKSGSLDGVTWERAPVPLALHPDLDLTDSYADPIKYLSIANTVLNPALMSNGAPWRGPREKSPVFFQILIEACSKEGAVVVDLTASTGASLRACRASGRNFFGLESDSKIFDSLLKPMLKPEEHPALTKRNKLSIPTGMD
jgi:hypothetical protein